MTNTTVTGNTSFAGAGGISNHYNASLTLVHSTVSGNTTTNNPGGGISMSTGTMALENSIVAGNSATYGEHDFRITGGTVTSTGTNLIGDNSTVETEFPAGPLAGTSASPLNPKLATLANYGGRTDTMPPEAGSPAIDGAEFLASTPVLDQRGSGRPFGSLPDLGAVEVVDSDGDGIPDFQDGTILDPDTDDDGVLDGADEDIDGDGVPNDSDIDAFDPDTDDDGIGDALDNNPLANNFCSGADAIISNEEIGGPEICAAKSSVTTESLVKVLAEGDLHLIAPVISFGSGFSVTGSLTVTSADPCPGCSQ